MDKLAIFKFHGIDCSRTAGSQVITECFMCGGSKLFINPKTGQYDCKNCGEKGNEHTFLLKYHLEGVITRTPKDVGKITRLRQPISKEQIEEHQLWISHTGEVMIPVGLSDKSLKNLRKWSPKTKVLYSTPDRCTLFYVQRYSEGPIVITEGEWDGLALQRLIQKANYEEDITIVAAPGANTFKDTWVSEFQGREVWLIYDNDHDKVRPNGSTFNPGKDGMEKVADKLKGVATKIKTIDWSLIKHTDVTADGYDIRDYAISAIEKKRVKYYVQRLFESCVVSEVSASVIKPNDRTDFQSVIDDFNEVYEFTSCFVDALVCAMSTIISLRVEGCPVWFFIVGPASSGKTTIIEVFEELHRFTEHLSKLTGTALVSGAKLESGEDPSMLPKLRDKSLFVKDFTAVLTMNAGDKENLFGMFRDIYDGRYTQPYGTGTVRHYEDLYMGVCAGVTQVINGENRSSLGERFLKINLLDKGFNQHAHIARALSNVGNKKVDKKFLQASINGFIEHLDKKYPVDKPETYPKFPQEWCGEDGRMVALSMLTATLRTTIARGYGRDIGYRTDAEFGSRLAVQLKKLGIAASMIYQLDKADERVYDLLKKVALDTCTGWNQDIMKILARNQESGYTSSEISEIINLHPNQVKKILEDALQLNIVVVKKVKTEKAGVKATKFFLSDHLFDLVKKAEIV